MATYGNSAGYIYPLAFEVPGGQPTQEVNSTHFLGYVPLLNTSGLSQTIQQGQIFSAQNFDTQFMAIMASLWAMMVKFDPRKVTLTPEKNVTGGYYVVFQSPDIIVPAHNR